MDDEQIFRDALEVLRRDGFHKGMYHDPSGTGHCALGCLDVALGRPLDNTDPAGLEVWEDAGFAANRLAYELFPDRVAPTTLKSYIAQVNDHFETSQEDIEVIFEKAAIRAAEQI